jgi:hypothetical protein
MSTSDPTLLKRQLSSVDRLIKKRFPWTVRCDRQQILTIWTNVLQLPGGVQRLWTLGKCKLDRTPRDKCSEKIPYFG